MNTSAIALFVIRPKSDILSPLLFGHVEKKLYLKGEEGG